MSSAATLEDVTAWLRSASDASERASLTLVRGQARYSEVPILKNLSLLFVFPKTALKGCKSAFLGGFGRRRLLGVPGGCEY